MAELIQNVKNGEVQKTKSSTNKATAKEGTPSKVGGELGKDAFLQLLVTQMKYQDPLNPSNDTEYISQLATFSQLEQLQNINTTTSNSQALGLVGKNVIMKNNSTTGNETYVSGKVDYVLKTSTGAQLSIDGTLYSYDQLDSVIDDTYLIEQGLPGVSQATKLTYDAANPKDLTFSVKLGSGKTVADNVAIAVGDKVIDSSLVKVTGNNVTIDGSAFEKLDNGTYKVTVVFDDSLYTTVNDQVSLVVSNAVIDATTSDSTAEVI